MSTRKNNRWPDDQLMSHFAIRIREINERRRRFHEEEEKVMDKLRADMVAVLDKRERDRYTAHLFNNSTEIVDNFCEFIKGKSLDYETEN